MCRRGNPIDPIACAAAESVLLSNRPCVELLYREDTSTGCTGECRPLADAVAKACGDTVCNYVAVVTVMQKAYMHGNSRFNYVITHTYIQEYKSSYVCTVANVVSLLAKFQINPLCT